MKTCQVLLLLSLMFAGSLTGCELPTEPLPPVDEYPLVLIDVAVPDETRLIELATNNLEAEISSPDDITFRFSPLVNSDTKILRIPPSNRGFRSCEFLGCDGGSETGIRGAGLFVDGVQKIRFMRFPRESETLCEAPNWAENLNCAELLFLNGSFERSTFEHPKYTCDHNPCLDQDELYLPSADGPEYFIQCGEFGQCFERECPKNTVWNQTVLNCI